MSLSLRNHYTPRSVQSPIRHSLMAQKTRGSMPNAGKTKILRWLREPRKSQCSCLSGPAGLVHVEGGRSRLALRSAAANPCPACVLPRTCWIGSARSSRRPVRIGSWRFPGPHVLPAHPPKKRGTAFKCYLVFPFLRRRCFPLR